MSVKWTAAMAANAIEEWAKKEIVNTSDRTNAFLKFFFGVSLSSVAAFATILKLYKGEVVTVDFLFYIAISFYLFSMLVILLSALRRQNSFNETTDLHSEYESDFNFFRNRMWAWFILWMLGLIFSGLSIYL